MAAEAALVTVNMEVGLDYWLPWDTLGPQSGKERAAQNHTTKNEAVRPTCVLYIPWYFPRCLDTEFSITNTLFPLCPHSFVIVFLCLGLSVFATIEDHDFEEEVENALFYLEIVVVIWFSIEFIFR